MEKIVFKNIPELKDSWVFNEEYSCWALNDVCYTPAAKVPDFQMVSIFVPKEYMNEGGTINWEGKCQNHTARETPVIFENNSAGYRQMPNVGLGEGRCYARQYLEQGYVYVSCGNRGADSEDADGNLCGKSPANLVDIKTAIRFLRHNAGSIPGDFNKMISVGWSAGGAMSSLIALTGNNKKFDKALEANGAYMDETDDVYAAQIYCPIVDLDHADLAYEWQFSADDHSEESPAGPAEVMTPFKRALSDRLRDHYVKYFNSLNLKSVESGEPLVIGPDGRSGSGYDYLMSKLSESATEFLSRLEAGELPENYTSGDYLSGNYRYMEPKRGPRPKEPLPEDPKERKKIFAPVMEEVQGNDKREWLSWDGKQAVVKDIDSYVMEHRRRMKPCTSFDILSGVSGENMVFGSEKCSFMHFNPEIGEAIGELEAQFPVEAAEYKEAFLAAADDEELKERVALFNPLNYIGTDEKSDQPKHYRICVGARDADTAFVISLELACKLTEIADDVIYKLIWDKPHCEADYEGDVIKWIESL